MNKQWSYSVVCLAQSPAGLNQDLLWTIPLVGFSAMLIVAALVLAFQTRNVPDYFSDSKIVALGIYNMVIVGGSMLTMMFLIKGNPDVQLLVRVTAVSVSVLSTVLILFVSKAHGIKTIAADVKVGHLANYKQTQNSTGASGAGSHMSTHAQTASSVGGGTHVQSSTAH
jgi:hypothetical protein